MSSTSSYAPVVTRWCSTCAAETGFEQPECLDGHGPDGLDCPEWVCVQCGDALLIGFEQQLAAEAAVRHVA